MVRPVVIGIGGTRRIPFGSPFKKAFEVAGYDFRELATPGRWSRRLTGGWRQTASTIIDDLTLWSQPIDILIGHYDSGILVQLLGEAKDLVDNAATRDSDGSLLQRKCQQIAERLPTNSSRRHQTTAEEIVQLARKLSDNQTKLVTISTPLCGTGQRPVARLLGSLATFLCPLAQRDFQRVTNAVSGNETMVTSAAILHELNIIPGTGIDLNIITYQTPVRSALPEIARLLAERMILGLEAFHDYILGTFNLLTPENALRLRRHHNAVLAAAEYLEAPDEAMAPAILFSPELDATVGRDYPHMYNQIDNARSTLQNVTNLLWQATLSLGTWLFLRFDPVRSDSHVPFMSAHLNRHGQGEAISARSHTHSIQTASAGLQILGELGHSTLQIMPELRRLQQSRLANIVDFALRLFFGAQKWSAGRTLLSDIANLEDPSRPTVHFIRGVAQYSCSDEFAQTYRDAGYNFTEARFGFEFEKRISAGFPEMAAAYLGYFIRVAEQGGRIDAILGHSAGSLTTMLIGALHRTYAEYGDGDELHSLAATIYHQLYPFLPESEPSWTIDGLKTLAQTLDKQNNQRVGYGGVYNGLVYTKLAHIASWLIGQHRPRYLELFKAVTLQIFDLEMGAIQLAPHDKTDGKASAQFFTEIMFQSGIGFGRTLMNGNVIGSPSHAQLGSGNLANKFLTGTYLFSGAIIRRLGIVHDPQQPHDGLIPFYASFLGLGEGFEKVIDADHNYMINCAAGAEAGIQILHNLGVKPPDSV